MLGGSGSRRRAGLGFTRGESRKQLGVMGRLRANSSNPFGVNPSQLTRVGEEGNLSLAEPSSPRSITSATSSAMDAILEQAKALSSNRLPRHEPPPVKQNPAIPSCLRRARSVPPPPASRPGTAPSGTAPSGTTSSGMANTIELQELKELVNVLQQRNKEYEERLASMQFPFYGIVREEVIYFFKDIPTNATEWEENKEGEASQNDWVPVLHEEKTTKEGRWVSVLYMDPDSGETDVFWTLKDGFAAFSLYPLLDHTVEDFV